ncbi:MAG: hypothetical protein HN904_19965 [Victivallales bacterium]|mgnify:CR=1 FL=1|nr:hypothetical protein [Victivallales bacterium]
MAAYLEMNYQGQPSRFVLTAIDRKRLHGYTKRVALDADGYECATAHLTQDGRFLLTAGSTADLYTNERGDSVPRADLVPVDRDGRALPTAAPTTGRPQEAKGPVSPEEILNCVVVRAYALTPESLAPALQSALARGAIFKVAYRPRKTAQATTAFLLANETGTFLVQTEPCGFEFVGSEQLPTETDIGTDDQDEEFDFDQHERWNR